MASFNQLIATPNLAAGITCIEGQGYHSAGLPEPEPGLSWYYIGQGKLACSDPRAWKLAIAPKITKDGSVFQNIIQGLKQVLPATSTLGLFKTVLSQDAATKQADLVHQNFQTNLNRQLEVPVGFFDDIFGSNDAPGSNFDAGLSGGGSAFDYVGLLNTGVGLANRFLGSSNNNLMIPPTMVTSATLPAVIGAGGMVVRGAMTALAARLAAVGLTRASAWSLLKSQGPTALLALGLTAAEVVTVARKGTGRRRMNMCNGRALRRAQRRLTSFHNFYKKTCGMPTYRHKKRTCK